jgi:hypothetical protein
MLTPRIMWKPLQGKPCAMTSKQSTMKMKISKVGVNKVGEAPNPYQFHSSNGGFGISKPHNLLSQTLAVGPLL